MLLFFIINEVPRKDKDMRFLLDSMQQTQNCQDYTSSRKSEPVQITQTGKELFSINKNCRHIGNCDFVQKLCSSSYFRSVGGDTDGV